MSSYATKEELENRIPESALAQLTTESGTSPEDTMLEEVLQEADGMIDTAANTAGYVTPIVSDVDATMSVLKTHEISIAKFLLLDRRGMTAYDPASEKLYQAALDFLSTLRKGDVELAGAPVKAPATTPTGAVSASSEANYFGRGTRRCNPLRGI